jgi:RNA polymerase sigma-70 factor (ECF subfamily)
VDGATIVAAYDRLVALDPSPVARLNRAVAIALGGDVERGLEEIDALDGLDDYQPYHAARADLLRRLGRSDASAVEYRTALALTSNEPERRFLERRLNEVSGDARE